MENINLDNTIIYYKVIKSKRKTCAIQIDIKGNVVVKVPMQYNKIHIELFLQQNKSWLVGKISKVEFLNKNYENRNYTQGEEFFYLGNRLPLHIEKIEGSSLALAMKEDGFYAKLGESITVSTRKNHIKQALILLYKKAARRVLMQKTEYFSSIIGVNFNKIFIKEQKTLWGSCSYINNINYNWKIIMAPEKIVDYLVVHELCHIKFRNHSKEYWNEVGKYLPDYKHRRKWLKENGRMLDLDRKIRN
ncbi:M48 family metallopeptidase [Clostridium oryzae]|uniref:YgjP-like metallopeptidase domain-containing protein n=1 Tax=Clostridium oryzae TaxID=1450648 RepID=A0A1V4IMQ2_9CLOT|nr:SprT family zinc-dependent metalloprotease [Clostridium oryzae]OPJ61312.1 hypothetical protein CLORY_23520 [Clostridium oryzae]